MKVHSVDQVEAEKFHSLTESGYSRPARVTCAKRDGSKLDVFVKFAGGVRHREFGLGAELVCSLLAKDLGLNIPTPFLVNITEDFVEGVPKSAQDLIRRSIGLNFGTESAPPGYSLVPSDPVVPIALRKTAAEIFAFDVLVQNYDRKSDNSNLLWDRKQILMIDHESALGTLLGRTDRSLHSLELDNFYTHVFFSTLSRSDAEYDRLTAAIEKLSSSRIDNLLGQIPASWHFGVDWRSVREHLVWVVENRHAICGLIAERLS